MARRHRRTRIAVALGRLVATAVLTGLLGGAVAHLTNNVPAAMAVPCPPDDPDCIPEDETGTIGVARSGHAAKATVTSAPDGISCGSTCSAEFEAGTSVTLTATFVHGFGLGSWGGCTSIAGDTCIVEVSTGHRTVTLDVVDTVPPTVTLNDPPYGAYRGLVAFSATAGDANGIGVVRFRVGGVVVHEDTSAPFAFTWDSTGRNETVFVDAQAIDLAGLTSSHGRLVTFDHTAPTGSITSPVAGAFITGPTTVEATASDLHSSVWGVGFYLRDHPTAPTYNRHLGNDDVAPYTAPLVLDGLQAVPGDGVYYLVLLIVDRAGNASSTSIAITVDREAPSLEITDPAPGRIISDAAIELAYTATDANGVSSVDFAYQNEPGGLFYPIPDALWDVSALADGPYTVRVRARDPAGLETTRTVDVTIDHLAPASRLGALPSATVSRSFPVSWLASDAGAGVSDYDVYYRTAAAAAPSFGPWAAWRLASTATSATFTGTPGTSYCLKVRARDLAGHQGAWTAPVCTAVPLDDRALTAAPASAWVRNATGAPDARYFQGTYSRSTASGATLTRSGLRARRIVLVSTRCATCGSVKVIWNGTVVRTVSLSTTGATKFRQLTTVLTFSTVQTGTLTLKQVSNGKPVVIDGVAVSKT